MDDLPCDVLTIIACLTAFVFLVWLRDRKSRNLELPPGPFAFPVIGNLPSLADGKVLQTFRKYRETYGDLYTLQLGVFQTVVVNGYDNLKELLVHRGDEVAERPAIFGTVDMAKWKGLGASRGQLWKVHRLFALKTLRNFGFVKSKMEANIIGEVETFSKELENKNGEAFDLDDVISISVSNIICSFVFGKRFDHSDSKFKKLIDLLNTNLRLLGPSAIVNFLPFLRYAPGDIFKGRQVMRNDDEVVEFIKELVQEHNVTHDEKNIRDYIDAYLKEMNQKTSFFTEDQLFRCIFDLFLAGTETTATSIKWAILFLLNNKGVQEKMYREITDVVGSRSPSLEDKPNLPYCEAVMLETLRCGDIAPLAVFHSCPKNVTFKGYTIPEGAIIVPNLDSVLSDASNFENPDDFNPQRFINDEGKLYGHEKVIPFSIGRRACLGENLARAEMFLFLTTMIQRFHFVPEDDKHIPPPDGFVGITHNPYPYKVRAMNR